MRRGMQDSPAPAANTPATGGPRTVSGHSDERGGMDLQAVAQRLESKEKLRVRYRLHTRGPDGSATCQVRVDRLLDVDCDRQTLYVSFEDDSVRWVQADEAIEVVEDDQPEEDQPA